MAVKAKKKKAVRGTLRKPENFLKSPHPNEMERRAIHIAGLLLMGKTYSDVQAEMKVGFATIGRARKWYREMQPAISDVEATGDAIAQLDLLMKKHWAAIERIEPGFKQTFFSREKKDGGKSGESTNVAGKRTMNLEAVILGHLKAIRECVVERAELVGILKKKADIVVHETTVNVAGDLVIGDLTDKEEVELDRLIDELEEQMAGARN